MSYARGKPLHPEAKKILVSLKQYFDRNKTDLKVKDSSAQIVADAIGVGLATVNGASTRP